MGGAGVTYDFSDAVVLVTGAARGMGRDLARRFAGFGAAVVASDVAGHVDALGYETAHSPELEETVAGIRDAGAEAHAVAADVRDEEQVAALVDETVERFGRLDVLVNNAGVFTGAPVTELTEEAWDAAIDINLKGPFLCSKHAARHMKGREGGGRIITVSSTSALVGIPNQASYQSSKHGVVGLTRTLALELAPFGVTVNTVCPTVVYTPMLDYLMEHGPGVLPGGRAPVRRLDGLPGARRARRPRRQRGRAVARLAGGAVRDRDRAAGRRRLHVQVSALECSTRTSRRIEARNPELNAIVVLDLERARDEAASPRPGPLSGVPFTVKEAIATAGLPGCEASRLRPVETPAVDAPVVARLREAGAILIGKTNISELCAHPDSSNLVYGATRNPVDPSRSAVRLERRRGRGGRGGDVGVRDRVGLRRLDPRAGALLRGRGDAAGRRPRPDRRAPAARPAVRAGGTGRRSGRSRARSPTSSS